MISSVDPTTIDMQIGGKKRGPKKRTVHKKKRVNKSKKTMRKSRKTRRRRH